MEDISFIILRHVNNKESNKYWNICIDRILNYYPDKLIVIIDDNSRIEPKRLGSNPKKIITINSEFPPQRGEFLPYYYINKNKFAKVNIILHDTVFLHKKIEEKYLQTNTFHFLWEFKRDKNYQEVSNYIKEIIKKFNNQDEIMKFYENDKNWNGCFGGMSIINSDYLNKVFSKSNFITVFKENINSRIRRMAFERIVAIFCCSEISFGKINLNLPNSVLFIIGTAD